jgi:hypothetical protein
LSTQGVAKCRPDFGNALDGEGINRLKRPARNSVEKQRKLSCLILKGKFPYSPRYLRGEGGWAIMGKKMTSLLLHEKRCFIRLPPDTLQNFWHVIT